MLQKQLAILSLELAKGGVPESLCRHVAHGVVLSCLCWCHENFTDLVGNNEELADRLEWEGDIDMLVAAMRKAGLIEKHVDEWFFPQTCPMAPEKVKKQWQRKSKVTWDAAIIRSNTFIATYRPPAIIKKSAPPTLPPPKPVVVDTTAPPKTDDKLFDTQQEIKPNGTSGYTATVDHWFEIYAKRYGRKYSFRKADGATLKRLLASHGADAIKQAMQRYIACTDPFYLGHELTLFSSRINKWLTTGRTGQPSYGGADEALPTIA